MTIIKGKANITAEVVCDSVSSVNGKRITTFCIEYPRIILSELNTHRMLSKNSSSSRAIPFDKMIENLKGRPVRFGAANAGMQDKGEDKLDDFEIVLGDGRIHVNAIEYWNMAKDNAINFALAYNHYGFHKQIYNRLLEPFQMMKTIVTATEWNNFFWLRDDEAADPTIQELARCMREAIEQSLPQMLKPGEWHLPFVNVHRLKNGNVFGYSIGDNGNCLSTEEAIIVSCARCAAVSFRNIDYDLAKCKQVYDRLINGGKVHGSALEHCATPMKEPVQSDKYLWEDGMTHMDKDGNMWSGNFNGWIQHRKLIPNENKKG